jgi:hypothetical protein
MEEPVTGPRSLLFVLLFISAAAGLASASAATTDIYFAQSAQGGNNGADCADAYAYNDGTHGINVSGHWAAGNTLHICGTISVAAGAGAIICQGSGSSGSPITIKFEAGAILQAPYFGTGGAAGIDCSGQSWITINGGNTGSATGSTNGTPPSYWTGGIIQNYANGTSGTSACPGINNTGTAACTYQVNPTTLIEALGVNHFIVENLSMSNAYVQTATDTVGGGSKSEMGIDISGSNWTITNNQIHDDGDGIDNTTYGNDTNDVVSYNYFSEDGWGMGCAGGSNTAGPYYFHDNWLHNWDRWTLGSTHVNGMFCYAAGGGGVSSLYLYNNVADGNQGTCCWTAWWHFGADAGSNAFNGTGLVMFNNITVSTIYNGNGLLQLSGGSNNQIYNNAFIQVADANSATNNNLAQCINSTWDVAPANTITFRNNILSGCTQPITLNGVASFTASNNAYGNIPATSPPAFAWTGVGSANTLSAWQSVCRCDSESITASLPAAAFPDLTITGSPYVLEGVPSAGFPGLEYGANLSSIATGALAALANSTTAGNTVSSPEARPSGTCSTQGTSSCWDIGPYEVSNGASDPPPSPPTGLTAAVD